MNINKKSFFDLIEKDCIHFSNTYRILPSVLVALAADISDYGSTRFYNKTLNIFKLPANENTIGWCYSKDTKKIYTKYSDCKENGAILYKAYGEPIESIKDFIIYIKNCRRSNNGPYRYTNVFDNKNYINSITALLESGFVTNYLNTWNENDWYNRIISIIEQNKLYELDNKIEWEDDTMSKKRKVKFQKFEPKNMHMYRVRLNWENPDTQIFASPNLDDALKYALSHEGYKVYIDDDGELVKDPWKKEEPEKTPIIIDNVKSVIHPIKGKSIKLDNTLIYKNAIDKSSFMKLSGTFYFYDSSITNGRAKITTHKDILTNDPKLILGYIKI